MRKRRKAPIQEAILEYLRDYKRDPENEGNSPTYSEIAEAIGQYPADIHNRVQRMEKLGLVKVNQRGRINLGGKYLPPE